MTTVCEILQRDHHNMARLLDLVEGELDRFEAGESMDLDLLSDIIDYALNFPDLIHHPLEDEIARRLSAREPSGPPIRPDVGAEHAALRQAARIFAAALSHLVREAEMSRDAFLRIGRDFVGLYRRHMADEDRLFFPRALDHLDQEDWRAIGSHRRIEDPLFGSNPERRYLRLVERLIGHPA